MSVSAATGAGFITNKEKNLDYSSFETMLSAPTAYRKSNEEECGVSGTFIPYVEIAGFIPESGLGGSLS